MNTSPHIIISSTDLERLEERLYAPKARARPELNGLRNELERAEIREPQDMPANVITMNSRARFRDCSQEKTYEFTLVYPNDADFGAGRISVFTPAGSALLGLSVGQEIDWPGPDQTLRMQVLEIVWQPEAAGRFDL